MKVNHRIIFLLTTLFVFSCMASCQARNPNGKLKKPVFVASNKESEIIDIKATDNYDSLSFKMEVVTGDMGDVRRETHYIETNGKERVYKQSYAGVYVAKYVFHKKGKEDSDTLYARHVQFLVGMENEIILNNEGTTLKIFGKNYGKNVIVSTPDNKIVTEKAITNGVTEVNIPTDVEYLNIDIKYDEQVHYTFKYPIPKGS